MGKGKNPPSHDKPGPDGELYQTITEQLPFGVSLIDAHGGYQYINPKFEEMFGYSLADVATGRLWFRKAFPDRSVRRQLVKCWFDDLNTNDPGEIRPRIFPVKCKDGSQKIIHFRSMGFPDGRQLIVYEDVTDKAAEEDRLKTSRQTYQALSDATFEAVFISKEGICLEANRSACEMFGYAHDELIGKFGTEVIAPEFRELVRRHILSGYEEPYEVSALRKDGGIFPAEVRGHKAWLGGQEVRITVVRDISDRHQALVEFNTVAHIVDYMPVGIFIFRYKPPDTLSLIRGNAEAERLTGIDSQACRMKEFGELWKGANRQAVKDLFLQVAASGRVHESEDLRYQDGENDCFFRVRAFMIPESRLVVAFENITRQKETQQALADSEEFLRTLFDSSLDAIVTVDGRRRITGFNPAFADLFGYGPEELEGRSARVIHCSGSAFADYGRTVYPDLEANGYWRGEWVFRKKSGVAVPMEIMMSVHRQADGAAPRYLAILRDITERKKNEARLNSERDRAQHYLDVAGVVFVAFDAQGNVTMINRKGQEVLGYQEDELIGRNWIETCLPGDARKGVGEVFQNLLSGRIEPVEYYENEVLTKSGERRVIAWHNSVLQDQSGGFVGILSSGEDLTERRRSEEQLSQIFNLSIDMIAIADINNVTFKTVNPAFGRVLGYPESELLGKPFMDSIHPEDIDRTEEMVNRLRNGQLVQNFENRYRRRHGGYVWLNWVARPVADKGVCYAIVRDITEQKKAEEKRTQLEQQLRQAHKMEALGTLAGGIAHDFNNVLSAIIGYTELALEDNLEGRASVAELEEVLAAAERAARLVKRILTFSRKVEPSLKPLDLNRDLRRAAEMLKRTIPKMIQVELNLSDDVGLVKADAGQIEQVILNLGANARDAMPMGGRLIIEASAIVLDEEYCRLHTDAAVGRYVRISVTDTGEGIKDDHLDSIFDPFFTTKEVGLGTGLGLAIVFGIVKSHQGHLTCHSLEGHGTTFNIFLPAMVGGGRPAVESGGADGQMLSGSETIMVVDDEPAIRGISKRILGGQGYRTVMASSGEEALTVFRTRAMEIDLVILDVSMPGMGGLRCLEGLREIRPDIKVIIASGYSRNGSLRDYVAKGDVGYMAKPFGRDEILLAVRKALDRDGS